MSHNPALRSFAATVLLILLSGFSCHAEAQVLETFQKSCGIIQTNFAGGTPHSCNGFLVKKDKQIFFITVAHVIEHSGKAISAKLVLPGFGLELNKDYSKVDFLEGDSTNTGKELGETTDILAIDVTNELSKVAEIFDNIIAFEALVSKQESNQIEIPDGGSAMLIGFPADPSGQISPNFETRNFRIYLRPGQFGELVRLPNGEKPAGIYLNTSIYDGDCGRPIISQIDGRLRLLGLVKSSVGAYGFANDSTAIVRTLKV